MKIILILIKAAYLFGKVDVVRGVLDTIITGLGGCAPVTSLNPFGTRLEPIPTTPETICGAVNTG